MLAVQSLSAQTPWSTVGPAGGDARAFAAVPGEPNHLYMGTTTSWLYESFDRGASWHRLAKLGASDDLILDHILVDPNNPSLLFVAAWTVGHPDGGVWISHDGGRSWTVADGLRGQSTRAFGQAPSDPRILFAGGLGGVFRSNDSGASWSLISPLGSREIHEVESLAVDPADPDIVYAGTWHLPWKTVDGGKTWHSIKNGLIDDSDVFSIIVDPIQPTAVFLSACSGIYKTESAGALFHKIHGIPASARRTRVLKQDPIHRNIVYAGTTEGLYKTVDGGKTFQRMTGPDVIVNDVYVDPRDTRNVLLATDRSGVLSSHDGGVNFVAANEGFSGRKVEALLVDAANPARLFAGVVNDKAYGGVFVSADGGAAWDQIAEGLDGRDVFVLAQAGDGSILAGTNHGIFALVAPSAKGARAHWVPRNTFQDMLVQQSTVVHKGQKINIETNVKTKGREFDGRVFALDLSSDAWLASTTAGLYTSVDHGASWQGGLVMGSADYQSVAAHGATLAAARRDRLVISVNSGQTWSWVSIPAAITRIDRIAFTPDGTLFLGGREGVNLSHDLGKSWFWIQRLPFRDINDLYYDAAQARLLVSSRQSDLVFAIDPVHFKWTWVKTGWNLFLVRPAGSRLVAASLYDGVLVEPRTVAIEAGQR